MEAKNKPTIFPECKRWDCRSRPEGDVYDPQAVAAVYGETVHPHALLRNDRSAAILDSEKENTPYIVLDMGRYSVGGYVLFRVECVSGPVTLRLSYSNWFDHIVDATYGETGDYLRGTCRYLGVELPVLPADPNRYELFTVSAPGVYFFPLLQGQLRYVRIQLDTPRSRIGVSRLWVENHGNLDSSQPTGSFCCDVEDYNRVWESGVWTAQLATIPHSDAWECVGGYWLPRFIERGGYIGYLSDFCSDSYALSFCGRISRNPSAVSALGFAVDVTGETQGLVGKLSLDGRLALFRIDGEEREPIGEAALPVPLSDNTDFTVSVHGAAGRLHIAVNGVSVFSGAVTLHGGSVGFFAEKEMWFAVRDVVLNGELCTELSRWHYRRPLGYLSDGATRDRLLWTGDIAFASRNVYYGSDPQYIASSIRMMMQNQTPDGYVNPSPYPGNSVPPAAGDYGPFPSSEFSAWFTPIVAEYAAFTGDRATAAAAFAAVTKNLEFICRDIDPQDGLFCTVPELSKNVFVLSLGKGGKYAYTNALVYLALQSGAYLAGLLGQQDQAERWRQTAARLHAAVREHLYDPRRHTLTEKPDTDAAAPFANALGVLGGVFDRREAEKLLLDGEGAGKLLGLSIRAMLMLGRDAEALKRIRHGSVNVNWIDAQKDWRHPATVSECMHYPESASTGDNWNDKSHPDAAISDIFSAYVLGVRIADTGFDRVCIEPHFLDVRRAQGTVPTPHGALHFSWELRPEERCVFRASLSLPEGCVAELHIPVTGGAFTASINGQPLTGSPEDLAGERWLVQELPAGEYTVRAESDGTRYAAYIRSLEQGTETAEAADSMHIPIGRNTAEEAQGALLWRESPGEDPSLLVDMGCSRRVTGLRFLPGKPGSGMPSDFAVTVYRDTEADGETLTFTDMKPDAGGIVEAELFTVLGLLEGRYIKVSVSAYNGDSLGVAQIDIR